MRIYLASRFSRVQEMRDYSAQLAEMGHEVTSRWVQRPPELDGQGRPVDEGRGSEARCAIEDLEDLRAADWIIFFSEPPRSTNSRGGRHVEFGAALALGMRMILVGPRENVFHYVPEIEVFGDWEALRAVLDDAARTVTSGDD
jgi:hypothetical protein